MSPTTGLARPRRATGAFLVLAVLGLGLGTVSFFTGVSQVMIDSVGGFVGNRLGTWLMLLGTVLSVGGLICGAVAAKRIGDTVDQVHEAAALSARAARAARSGELRETNSGNPGPRETVASELA